MIDSFVLVEESDVERDQLRGLSLMNAKQLVIGSMPGSVIIHVAATSMKDLSNAMLEIAKVKGVTGVVTLTLRTKP